MEGATAVVSCCRPAQESLAICATTATASHSPRSEAVDNNTEKHFWSSEVKEDFVVSRKMPNYLVSSILNSEKNCDDGKELTSDDEEKLSVGNNLEIEEEDYEEEEEGECRGVLSSEEVSLNGEKLGERSDEEEDDIGLDLTANSACSDVTDLSISPDKRGCVRSPGSQHNHHHHHHHHNRRQKRKQTTPQHVGGEKVTPAGGGSVVEIEPARPENETETKRSRYHTQQYPQKLQNTDVENNNHRFGSSELFPPFKTGSGSTVLGGGLGPPSTAALLTESELVELSEKLKLHLTGIMEDTVQRMIVRIRETVRQARESAAIKEAAAAAAIVAAAAANNARQSPAPLPPVVSANSSTPRGSWPSLFYNPFPHHPTVPFSCPPPPPPPPASFFQSVAGHPFHQFFGGSGVGKKTSEHHHSSSHHHHQRNSHHQHGHNQLFMNHASPSLLDQQQTEALPLVIPSGGGGGGPRRKRTKVTDNRLSPRTLHSNRCSNTLLDSNPAAVVTPSNETSVFPPQTGGGGPGSTNFTHDDLSSLYSLGGVGAVDRLSPSGGCDSMSQDSTGGGTHRLDALDMGEACDPGLQTITLTPVHLRKAKLMFFYTRYPNSSLLKAFFGDIKFNKNNTAQLVKWFSNFREFYYIQMEKYARAAINDGVRDAETIHVTLDSELYRVINLHYNRNNQIDVPEPFRNVVEATLREFFKAIYTNKDQEQSWKKPIYKVIARMDQPVPEFFKSTNWMNQLTDS